MEENNNPRSENKQIFIGNLEKKVEDTYLRDLFGKYGEVSDCFIVKDKRTHFSKGVAYVTFLDPANNDAAIQALNDYEIRGKKIRVSLAQPKTDKPEPSRYDDDLSPRRESHHTRSPVYSPHYSPVRRPSPSYREREEQIKDELLYVFRRNPDLLKEILSRSLDYHGISYDIKRHDDRDRLRRR